MAERDDPNTFQEVPGSANKAEHDLDQVAKDKNGPGERPAVDQTIVVEPGERQPDR